MTSFAHPLLPGKTPHRQNEFFVIPPVCLLVFWRLWKGNHKISSNWLLEQEIREVVKRQTPSVSSWLPRMLQKINLSSNCSPCQICAVLHETGVRQGGARPAEPACASAVFAQRGPHVEPSPRVPLQQLQQRGTIHRPGNSLEGPFQLHSASLVATIREWAFLQSLGNRPGKESSGFPFVLMQL